jgi:hypothetical protein
MTELHRFTDPDYAALTLAMRDRENPGAVFDRLAAMGLVTLHTDDERPASTSPRTPMTARRSRWPRTTRPPR